MVLMSFIFLTNSLWVPISDKNKLSYPNRTQGHLRICVTTWAVPCGWRSWLCGWHSECCRGWYECRPRSRAEIQSWDATCYKLGNECKELWHNLHYVPNLLSHCSSERVPNYKPNGRMPCVQDYVQDHWLYPIKSRHVNPPKKDLLDWSLRKTVKVASLVSLSNLCSRKIDQF